MRSIDPQTGLSIPTDWPEWYLSALDGLKASIASADIPWALDPDTDEPLILAGQRRPAGIDTPHAMILRFQKQLNDADSTRSDEHHDIEAEIAAFRDIDPVDQQEGLLQAIADMGQVENALYSDRSLGGAVEYLTVTQSDAFEMQTDRGDETVADIQVSITNTATHPN